MCLRVLLIMVLFCCVPGWGSAQMVSIREAEGIKRTSSSLAPAHGPVDLFVWPATVVIAGERLEGVVTVIADPVYRWYWWSFRNTNAMAPTTPSALAEDVERRFVAYPTAEKLVVLSPTHRVIRIAFGTDFYSADAALPALVRAAFNQRLPLLNRFGRDADGRYDFFDKEPDVWTAVGGDFFEDLFNARPQLDPIRIESVTKLDSGWEIRLHGRFPGRLAAVFLSSEFEIQRAIKTSMTGL